MPVVTSDMVESMQASDLVKFAKAGFVGDTTQGATKYLLPGIGTQETVDPSAPVQASPLLRYYSPRLLGAPPQLTNQCDMRILSSDGINPGPVGDFYLTKILQDSNIANFAVGRARFIGGMSSFANVIREMYYYGKALSSYDIFDQNGSIQASQDKSNVNEYLEKEASVERYKQEYGERDNDSQELITVADKVKNFVGSMVDDIKSDSLILNIEGMLKGRGSILDSFGNLINNGAAFISALKTSLSVQQPFYVFEEDWSNYINNVKMMINTAVIMLGLQNASVRIGDTFYPIGMEVKVKAENDVWSNYRFITPTSDLGDVNAIRDFTGGSSQYISFMVDPSSVSESYNNTIGTSSLMSSVMQSGNAIGNEIAFISNSSAGGASDTVVALTKSSKEAAEEVLSELSKGKGRFTAAIASSMAKSFVGDHTIYPDIFQGASATTGVSLTVHLVSDAGDPYSYFINILVPLFYILGMALPELSSDNASAYTYPPLIQCNIPGMWGTRLGMIQSVQVNKNPSGKDVSINGYPLAVDVTITVNDLQHVLTTSPMNKVSTFLNNQTMFDYIAQSAGVDKFRVNGAMRTVARLALATSYTNNIFNNIGDALLNDWHSFINRKINFDLI